ncbi:MAG: HTH domain-containing protein [Bacteroidota bacterium]
MYQLKMLDRIDGLIRRKATGRAIELSDRLKVSERTVYNLLNTLRNLGAEIEYDKKVVSYVYTNNITFDFNISKLNKKIKEI